MRQPFSTKAPIFVINSPIRWFRSRLKRFYPLRSTYHFLQALLARVRWRRKESVDAHLHQQFEQTDPWKYTGNPIESKRFCSALHLLDAACPAKMYESALEIGCAEGIFTVMLSPRCTSLLSVDISTIALARAAKRCAGKGVNFKHWDLAHDPVPAHPDLVVIMDVLEYFFRPADIRNARNKLVSALRPGGHLLLGNSRQDLLFETAWWGKYILRGGKRIADFFSEHPQLKLIAIETGDIYINAIFRKEEFVAGKIQADENVVV